MKKHFDKQVWWWMDWRGFVPVIILSTLVGRLIMAYLVQNVPVSDSAAYHQFAIWMAEGKGYLDIKTGNPTAFWPVGYPAFLSFIYRFFGVDVMFGEMANGILSVVIMWLCYDISRRLFCCEKAARLLLLILALYPAHWFFSMILASEMLALTLVLVIIDLSMRRGVPVALACGVAAGLAMLVKPQTLAIAGFCWMFSFGYHGWHLTSLRHWARITVIYLVVLVVVMPWVWRNHQLLGAWIPVSTNGGINMFIGNNPEASGTYQEVPRLKALYNIEDEVERDKEAWREVRAYVQEQPLEFLARIPAKLASLYFRENSGSFEEGKGYSWFWQGLEKKVVRENKERVVIYKEISNLYYYVLALLSWLGLFVLVWRERIHFLLNGQAIPLVAVVWFTAVYLIFFGTSRFHFLMMPLLAIYATAFVGRFVGSGLLGQNQNLLNDDP